MLEKAFVENNKEAMEKLLNNNIKEPKNGKVFCIEDDIKGYYNIGSNDEIIKVIGNKYLNKNRTEIYNLILKNIKLTKEENFQENIYVNKIIGIKFNDKIINVNEIKRKDWKYILYIDKSGNYYLDKLFGTIGMYSKTFKIKDEDKEIIKNGKDNEIEQIIEKYN
jgi:hypothetical protein